MLTIETFKALLLGFTIGLTGALVPGPMLFATIELSLKKGWLAGPKVVFGHMLVELVLSVLILFGVASLMGSGTISAISVIGGLALVIFGLLTAKDAKAAASAGIPPGTSGLKLSSSPIALGFFTSVSNPYFWIWWLTAGSALVLRAYELGALVSLAYLLGHWTADLSWFTAVSGSFSRGKTLFSGRTHEMVLYVCGGFLVIFGLYFMLNYNNPIQLS
ncbi:Transporter, LysE family [Methanosarcina siciliae C2J]|uniref:Transporter, LysE family n=3 Tax=Methanosarcina siciliae TaxID=38027 RepID=A0A0E3LA07_9EURY|nr:LysE family transporter [Methanosarcina siciliae]AKB27243.1 Transporter, LysE family [Methanosarcina siciliae T4/M]AKB31191.1 Transporter, LysE family [Methanosarcina siciliae HI350]AKB35129.1 Transporter, LysE family [Methanosarcina siciliae C2J]